MVTRIPFTPSYYPTSGDKDTSSTLLAQEGYISWEMAQTVKSLPVMWETWVQSLGWEDPLNKGTATRSSILAWRIPWTEEPCGIQSMGSQRIEHD